MSNVRGDDDVLALLNEMAGEPGSGRSSAASSSSSNIHNKSTATSSSSNSQQQYCINEQTSSSTSIAALIMDAYQQSPPTNPQIEIIRHRVHEKFKTSFYDLFRGCVASHSNNAAQSAQKSGGDGSSSLSIENERNECIKSTIHTLWTNMPCHSIWERFQFSLKTLESGCVREVQCNIMHRRQSSNAAANNDDDGSEQTAAEFIPPWCLTTNATTNTNEQQQQLKLIEQLVNPTSHQIQSYILHGRNHGTLYEPLLPVPTISTYNKEEDDESLEMREVNTRYRKGTLQLLQMELKFQMRRTLKQLLIGGGGKKKKLSIDTLFDALYVANNEDGLEDTDSGNDAKKKKKKSKKKKDGKNDNQEDDTQNKINKEEYILQTIYNSQQFQRLTIKLHKKFHYLADEYYNTNFLGEIQKLCNRLLLEEQSRSSSSGSIVSGGGTKKKRRKKQKSGSSSIPKITFVDTDTDNNIGSSVSGSGNNKKNQDQQMMVTCSGISLRINQVHKNKLYSLYQRTLSNLLVLNHHEEKYEEYLHHHFPKLLFTILLRYDALEGAGLQSAIPPSVFDFLAKQFDCGGSNNKNNNVFECFASPFNCWFDNNTGGNFGSAFGDTDAFFGSRGSFFGMNFMEMAKQSGGGCFQANPPFASEFIDRMCHRMHQFLRGGDDNDGSSGNNKTETVTVPIMFVIFVPAWTESTGWKTLCSSLYMAKHILLSQKDDVHYYAEGTQHRRAMNDNKGGTSGSHRIASFDTSVFFLQNTAAKEKWSLSNDDETSLKTAFAMKSMDNERKEERANAIKRRNLPSKPDTKKPHRKTQAGASSVQQKKRKKKQLDTKEDLSKKTKKKTLMSGGKDEMNILESMGILNDDDKQSSSKVQLADAATSVVESHGSKKKRKKKQHKR